MSRPTGSSRVTVSSTRTHTFVTFANPYLRCDVCDAHVVDWHDPAQCGTPDRPCPTGAFVRPCRHTSGIRSDCPSWSPAVEVPDPSGGCRCDEHLGRRDHPLRPHVIGVRLTSAEQRRG